jgi:hypothetical protein
VGDPLDDPLHRPYASVVGPPLTLAFVVAIAFGVGHGIVGALIGFVAGFLIYLAIGAIVWMGRR